MVGGIFDQQETGSVGMILFTILWKFVLNVVGSLAIGGACALICSKIFQKARFISNNPVAEVVMLYVFGIISYLIA